MLVAIAYAAEGAAGAAPNPLGALVPFVLIFVIFYFLLIRPQQKKAKAHTLSLDALKSGDPIVTTGGIFGTVVKIDGDKAVIEIADKVKVTVLKAQLNTQAGTDKDDKKDSKKDNKKEK